MKHIVLTVLVCLDVAAFTVIYRRGAEMATRVIVERLSEIQASSFLETGVHELSARQLR
jgi:hypothetical protein